MKWKVRSNKKALTTGDISKICGVTPRTVSKWFDNGSLKGYKIPLGKDRRVRIGDLLIFMREYGLPEEYLKDYIEENLVNGKELVHIDDKDD